MKIVVVSFPDTIDISSLKIGDEILVGEVVSVGDTKAGTVVITASIPNPEE